jgi:hypothetical protein
MAQGALKISEPATILYGRVYQPSAHMELLLTEGELVWTIRNAAQGGREYRLATRLESLGEGRFSYRLSIPHQVLAYDLTVADKAVPLTASGAQLQHVAITVNGHPASIVAPAIDSFTAQQANRAATYRVDLELTGSFVDSDGDGLPDWWEDRNGYDKWDPADGARIASGGGGPGSNGSENDSPLTLETWRAIHFPGAAGDLDQFAQGDFDGDGIANLLEYAFSLNPKAADEAAARGSLPRTQAQSGRVTLQFGKRANATDLEYIVELSNDLFEWRRSDDLPAVPAPNGGEGLSSFELGQDGSTAGVQFMRVRVQRNP